MFVVCCLFCSWLFFVVVCSCVLFVDDVCSFVDVVWRLLFVLGCCCLLYVVGYLPFVVRCLLVFVVC